MKSAGNRGILNGCLQMLHVRVFLITTLGTSNMAESVTDQHKCRVAIWQAANNTGVAADIPVQPLNHIMGAETGPVAHWENHSRSKPPQCCPPPS